MNAATWRGGRLASSWSAWLMILLGCQRTPTAGADATTSSTAPSVVTPVGSIERAPPPHIGMVFVPSGALVAGSPPDVVPRRPDRELPGEQVMLDGFYIDVYPYPNEPGAIPLSGVTQREAAALCGREDKRLCTELEWERACKGPNNHIYAWGNQYRSDVCRTSGPVTARPSGLFVACRSGFGMHDSHGGLFEWTQSRWQRPGKESDVAVRGGNGPLGDLAARCANVEPRNPKQRSQEVGFRCCRGPTNQPEVVLDPTVAPPLTRIERIDQKFVARFPSWLPLSVLTDLGSDTVAAVYRHRWVPVPNDPIELFTLCGTHKVRLCGLLVLRLGQGQAKFLGFAGTGYVASKLYEDRHSRDLWVLGSDDVGQYKRRIRYAWGAVEVGGKERLLPKERAEFDEPPAERDRKPRRVPHRPR